MPIRFALAFVAVLANTSIAFAHVGDHTGFDLAALLTHLSEPDHLALIAFGMALAVAIAFQRPLRAAFVRFTSRKGDRR